MIFRNNKWINCKRTICKNLESTLEEKFFLQSWHLLVIVVMISTGLLLFTYKSTEFHSTGFSLVSFSFLSLGSYSVK